MGYYSRYIFAEVDDPKQISLSGNPCFVTFSNTADTADDKPAKMRIKIYRNGQSAGDDSCRLVITLRELQSGESHAFIGVTNKDDLNRKSFLLSGRTLETEGYPNDLIYIEKTAGSNLRECLLRNDFVRNNFEVTVVPLSLIGDEGVENFWVDEIVELTAKIPGKQFDCEVLCEYQSKNFLVKEKEIDLRLTFNDMDYDTLTEDDRTFYWQYSYADGGLRPAMMAEIRGSFTPDEAAYKLVKPEPGKYTEEEAEWANLCSLYEHLYLREVVEDYANFVLNEEERSIDFYPIVEKSKYSFKGVITWGNWINLESQDTTLTRYRASFTTEASVKNDSLDFGTGLHNVELDVYTNTGVFLGCESRADTSKGAYLTTLSKSYSGQPLWFDMNTLQDKRMSFSTQFLSASNDPQNHVWVDAGTVTDYRFVAKITDGANTFPFYQSNVRYVLNGYARTLNNADLSAYVYDRSADVHSSDFVPIKPLTTRCERSHIKGQEQYFNFLLKDPDHKKIEPSTRVALEYKMYTQSGLYIGTELGRDTNCNQLHIANTTSLDLDKYLPQYKGKVVGRIDVCLLAWYHNSDEGISISPKVVSEPMVFRILPEVLHSVNNFAFLNSLGGWDSFSFGEKQSFDFKTSTSTIQKTVKPQFARYTEIESVAAKTATEQYVAQSSAIPKTVVEWLKELSVSKAVFELSTGRYIIVDELNLKGNTTDDLYQLEMKYRYSDTFNGRLK